MKQGIRHGPHWPTPLMCICRPVCAAGGDGRRKWLPRSRACGGTCAATISRRLDSPELTMKICGSARTAVRKAKDCRRPHLETLHCGTKQGHGPACTAEAPRSAANRRCCVLAYSPCGSGWSRVTRRRHVAGRCSVVSDSRASRVGSHGSPLRDSTVVTTRLVRGMCRRCGRRPRWYARCSLTTPWRCTTDPHSW